MTDEWIGKGRYKMKALVATATKVGEAQGKDILKINVPIEEDSKTLLEVAKQQAQKEAAATAAANATAEVLAEEQAKKVEKKSKKIEAQIKEINIINKKISGDRMDMNENDIEAMVDSRVNKKLFDMDIQKTIRDIGLSSLQTEKKVSKIEEQITGLGDVLKGLVESQKGIKDELESEIGETKKEVGNVKDDIYKNADKIEHVHQKVGEIDKKIPEKVLCSGEKGCNAEIEVGSSYCPNCGRGIDKWEDMPDWLPYEERN